MKKILFIDDDPEFRDNMAEILRLSHYDVDLAGNAKEGVAIAGWKGGVPEQVGRSGHSHPNGIVASFGQQLVVTSGAVPCHLHTV